MGTAEDGFVATPSDWRNLINYIVDPAIYVFWFSNTRTELKLAKGVCLASSQQLSYDTVTVYICLVLSVMKDILNELTKESFEFKREDINMALQNFKQLKSS